MQYLKSVWTSFKGLDEEKKFFLIVVIAVALLAASGHTYVFIKKSESVPVNQSTTK